MELNQAKRLTQSTGESGKQQRAPVEQMWTFAYVTEDAMVKGPHLKMTYNDAQQAITDGLSEQIAGGTMTEAEAAQAQDDLEQLKEGQLVTLKAGDRRYFVREVVQEKVAQTQFYRQGY